MRSPRSGAVACWRERKAFRCRTITSGGNRSRSRRTFAGCWKVPSKPRVQIPRRGGSTDPRRGPREEVAKAVHIRGWTRANGALAYERDGPRFRLLRVPHRTDQGGNVGILLIDDEDRLAGGKRLECRGSKELHLRARSSAQDDDLRWRMDPQFGCEVIRSREHGTVPACLARERTDNLVLAPE